MIHLDTAAANPMRTASRRLRALRRERLRHMPPELATGPAWDLLLELEDEAGDAVDSALSPATRERWLRALSAHGLVTLDDGDPAMARLSPAGRARIEGYLSACIGRGLL